MKKMDEVKPAPARSEPLQPRPGARVEPAQDQKAAANAVRQMFSSIAPRYDLLNHVLSLNVDRYWWWRTARRFRHIVRRADATVLDLCCGTGDMTFALYRQAGVGGASIVGADFAHPMLCRATQKSAGLPCSGSRPMPCKCPLPMPASTSSPRPSAFAISPTTTRACAEIHRVLAADGEVAILDFGEPRGLLGKFYRFYFRRVLPAIGSMLSRNQGPLRLSARQRGALPAAAGDALPHASRRLPRGQLHALHLRRRRRVLGQEVGESKAGVSTRLASAVRPR